MVLEALQVQPDFFAVDLKLGIDFITRLGSHYLLIAVQVLLIFVFSLLVRCVYVED